MSEKSHNWIVPYGNLMTILMIFFLLLYAFTYLTGRVDYEKVVASIAKGFGREIPYKEVELAEYLEDYFSRKQLLEGFKLEPDRIKLIFSIPLFFETGSTKLKPQAVEILNDIYLVVRDIPNNIIIEGFSTPERNDGEYLLSAQRALEIGKFFMKKGIDPLRIVLKGWGSGVLLYPKDDPRYEFNNRVEISIARDVSTYKEPLSERLIKMREYYYYGQYYYRQKNFKKASEYFEKILKIDPSHWKARQMLKKMKNSSRFTVHRG